MLESGLGFNGVVIDLQHHFMICLNIQSLYKFRTEIYDIVVDFKHLSAIESRSRVATSSVNLPLDVVGVMMLVTPGGP